MGTLRGACVQAMLWHSLGRALVALWQQFLLWGARLRRGARAILHDRRPQDGLRLRVRWDNLP